MVVSEVAMIDLRRSGIDYFTGAGNGIGKSAAARGGIDDTAA
jgi:hypothetical protein